MLVLSRKVGEDVRIGSDITITILEVQGNRVKVGISAPANRRVVRGELLEWQDASPAAPAKQAEQRKTATAWIELPAGAEVLAAAR